MLELEFLDVALSLLEGLEVFASLGLGGSKLNLKLTDASLKLSHGSTATLGSKFIGLTKPHLKSTLGFSLSSGMVLLSPEFISKASSINHSSLSLFLRGLSLSKGVINLSMQSMDSRFHATLVRGSLGVDGSHVIDRATGFNQFHVSLLLATVSRIKESP